MSPISTQTSTSLTSDTPRKIKFRQNIKSLTAENKYLRERVQVLENQVNNKLDDISLDQYMSLTFKFCSSVDTAKCINMQVAQGSKKAKGRRYSKDFKIECLSIYFSGPRVYKKYLMNKYCLPSPNTLLKEIRAVKIGPGLENPELYKLLKKKVDGFQEQNKYCLLCFDEMSIKANLFYERNQDSIIGLAIGHKGEKIFKPALTACVLMLRGLYCKWKQPLAYFLCHTSCPAELLLQILTESLQKLETVGLKVCAVTSDMGSNNIKLSNILNVSPEHTGFYLNNHHLFYIFDIPHIIKAIRNMLMKYNFYIDGKKISWQYIRDFYEMDKKFPVKAAHKLTDSHIYPTNFQKMKVKLATQVFSYSVHVGMSFYIRFGSLPMEATDTAKFVNTMDQLFDVLNSSQTFSSKKYNAAFKGTSLQLDFLKGCLSLFEKLEVRDRNNSNITKKMKFIKSIKISINSVVNLYNFLRDTAGFEYLLTKRLNQDCLENHFGKIRSENGNCINPTPIQFRRTFKKLQCVNLLNSGTENCEADVDQMLLKLPDFKDDSVPEDKDVKKVNEVDTEINSMSYSKDELLQKNFIRYVCGYLLNKALRIHSCDTCSFYSKEHTELDDSSVYCFLKAYENANKDTFGNLQMPNNKFVELICKIETIFQENFEKLATTTNISSKLFNLSSVLPFSHPCKYFPKEFVLRLYLRVRIYYTLKTINGNFKNINKNKLIIWRNL